MIGDGFWTVHSWGPINENHILIVGGILLVIWYRRWKNWG